MIAFTSDQWVIVALIFILGLLIGAFLTAGGRRKWKARYREESTRREKLERDHREHVRNSEAREKEWASRDSKRAPVVTDSGDVAEDRRASDRRASERRTADRRSGSDVDGDGVRDDVDRRPTDDSKA